MTSSMKKKDIEKVAEQVEISVKNDIIKQEHNLPSARNKNLLFSGGMGKLPEK